MNSPSHRHHALPLTILFLSLPASPLCLSDTLPVLPGESIQAQVDAAVAGDIIAIFGGTYNQDVTVNKAVRLVEVSGQEVTITGTVTFSGVTDPPPFEGFTVGSASKGIVVTDTADLLIRDIQNTAGFGLRANGTSVVFVEGSSLKGITANSARMEVSNSTVSGNINQSGDLVEISDCTMTGNISQTGGKLNLSMTTVSGTLSSTTNAQETCCYRFTATSDVSLASQKAWFGYSKARSFNFTGSNAKVVVVGAEIDRANEETNGMKLGGSNNSYVIANSVIKGVRWNNTGSDENGIRCDGNGHRIDILNNWISMDRGSTYYSPQGDGVWIHGTPTTCRIYNNIIMGAFSGIDALFGVEAKNNLIWNATIPTRGGVVAEGTISTDPLFTPGDAPNLQPASPCIDAGIPNPIFNDIDGTRNDIGPSGGCWYDPDGWTTENPVVISYDLSPEQVLEGVNTEVTISDGKAVSQP
jgi:hypothetical protein